MDAAQDGCLPVLRHRGLLSCSPTVSPELPIVSLHDFRYNRRGVGTSPSLVSHGWTARVPLEDVDCYHFVRPPLGTSISLPCNPTAIQLYLSPLCGVRVPSQCLLLDPRDRESRLVMKKICAISSLVYTPFLYLHLSYITEVVVHIGRHNQKVSEISDYT